MARLTCSVRVVQLCIESRLWMEKLEDQLMSASGKLHRGMRWPVKVRKGPKLLFPPFRAHASVSMRGGFFVVVGIVEADTSRSQNAETETADGRMATEWWAEARLWR